MALKSVRTNTLNRVSDINGLVHINTTTFSAVASQSIDDVFSANFTNYFMILTATPSPSTTAELNLRLRKNGSDNSTTNFYLSQRTQSNATTVTGNRRTGTSASFQITISTARSSLFAYFYAPFVNTATTITGSNNFGTGAPVLNNFSIGHNFSSAFDGFTLFMSTGNISGTVQVFGLRD